MVKALHHFMFVKPSTLHHPCIIHRQNQCHKYRQNHPFPMIFSWGFIGNGRNVSICSPVARRGSTADRVDWQGRLRVTALRQSVLRQTIFKQGQHYNKYSRRARRQTGKPTNMQNSRTGPTDNISEARPTVRCLLVFASWGSSVSRAHRHPYFIANSYHIDDAAHSPASGAAPAGWD